MSIGHKLYKFIWEIKASHINLWNIKSQLRIVWHIYWHITCLTLNQTINVQIYLQILKLLEDADIISMLHL